MRQEQKDEALRVKRWHCPYCGSEDCATDYTNETGQKVQLTVYCPDCGKLHRRTYQLISVSGIK